MGQPAKPFEVLDGQGLKNYVAFLKSKYSKVCSRQLLAYTLRYEGVYGNLSLVESIPSTVRNNALRAIVAFSSTKGNIPSFMIG